MAFMSDSALQELAARRNLSLAHLRAANAALKWAWHLVGEAVDHGAKPRARWNGAQWVPA